MKEIKVISLALLYLVTTAITCAGQDRLTFQRIGPGDGFPQSMVQCILQGSKGFMWFGTENGLNKYDGYNFTLYNYRENDPAGPGHRYIRTLYEDPEGTLWVGTNGSLDKFNRDSETFTHYYPLLKDTSETDATPVFSILASAVERGILWIGTVNGLERFDKKKGTFTLVPLYADRVKNIKRKLTGPMFEDQTGMLWFATFNGLWKYDIKNKILTNYKHDPNNPDSLSDDAVTPIIKSRWDPGSLWVGTRTGLNRYDPEKETFTRYLANPRVPHSLSGNYILFIFDSPVEENILWIGTYGGGLNKFNIRTGKFVHYKSNPNNNNSLATDYILSIYQTPSGVLWVGTTPGGLTKAEGNTKKFTHYHSNPNLPGTLSSNFVYSLYEAPSLPGIIWVGTEKGLDRLNRQTGKFTRFPPVTDNSKKPEFNRIHDIYECPSLPGTLWIGTYRRGIFKLDLQTNAFTHYKNVPDKPGTLSHNTVYSLHESSAQPGMLWAGTHDGVLNKLDINTGTVTRYRLYPDNPQRPNMILSIYQCPVNREILWAGTIGKGLIKFNVKTGESIAYLQAPKTTRRLSGNSILSLHGSPANPMEIWVGTVKGLFKFDSGTSEFHQPKGSELPADAEINAILEDNGGNLWISSAEGLFAFNPAGGTVKKYDAGDGLQANLFSHAACRGRSGEMFFGGYNGFNVFHPGRIRDNLHVPPVVITGFRLFDRPVKIGAPGRDGRPILEKSITDTRQITLTYKDKIFSFQFAALDYTRPQKNRFAYKMEGFDDHWNYIGGRRFVTFTGLLPGTYTFRVKGSNNDGIWNETGTSLRILITPPWWRTGWAYALYIFSLAAVILGLNRLQRVRLLRKERDKAALREARLRARAAEAQARAVDAEHRRKTQELEDARILQLSMLPKRLPELPGIGIAVYMKTATEVGGDYYDFYTGYDHSLTVAVGDATGHGLKAGTMVSIMKGIFMSEAGTLRRDIDAFFNKSSHTIKRMQLGNLFMGLTVVRLDDCRATVACAGMPPVYLYRGKKKIVEAINIKAPPLGAFEHIIYRHETIELQKGDTMLLFSDGLPELFNGDGEMFGYPRFKQLFREVGENAPRMIVDRLANAGEQWLSGKPRDDDITFVVLKIK